MSQGAKRTMPNEDINPSATVHTTPENYIMSYIQNQFSKLDEERRKDKELILRMFQTTNPNTSETSTPTIYQEATMQYQNVTDVQIEVIKELPIFQGNKEEYTIWKSHVMKVMEPLESIPEHTSILQYHYNLQKKNHGACRYVT